MSAREFWNKDLRQEVYMDSNNLPIVGGYTAEQWRSYADEREEDLEQYAAYAIARWLDACGKKGEGLTP